MPTAVTTSHDWARRAACRGERLAVFFPDKGGDIGPARAICASCPVRRDCFEDAMKTGDVEWGIRAGMTPRERQRARRRWLTDTLELPPIRRTRDNAVPRLTAAEHARFEAKLRRKRNGCRVWTGGVDRRRRCGRLHLNRCGVEMHVMPHRIAFVAYHGRQPQGLIRQTCGDSLCCAAEHLVDAVTVRAAPGRRAA